MSLEFCYLHGLASWPESPKALMLKELCEENRWGWSAPDFNLPEFSTLTVTRILSQLEAHLSNLKNSGPLILAGSSLGGFCAATYVALQRARAAEISKLVLLAPAFRFDLHKKLTAEAIASWRRSGSFQKWHSREGRELPLLRNFIDDILNYPALPEVSIPTLVLHGREDETIDIAHSREFASRSPQATLIELPTNHEMTSAFGEVRSQVSTFLGLLRTNV